MEITEAKEDKPQLELNKPLNICRCCLAEGCYKDISSDYYWLGELEVYEHILKETLDVCISYQNIRGSICESRLICEMCIVKLREASKFKKQILETEKNFSQYLEALYNSKAEVVIKNELDYNVQDGNIANDDRDDSTELLDNERLAEVKSEDDDSDFDLATIKKMTRDKKTNKKPVKRKAKSKDGDQLPAVKKRKKKGDTSTDEVPLETDFKLRKDKGADVTSKKIKENILKLILNSNICLFRHGWTNYKCFYCHKKFVEMSLLKNHSVKHTVNEISWKIRVLKLQSLQKVDISDAKCKICDTPCHNLMALQNHLQGHDVEFYKVNRNILVPYRILKNFDCVECDAKYNAMNKLVIHMNTHFSNYVCDTCGQKFSSLRSLNSHNSNLHKENICKLCNIPFLNSSKLMSHRKKVHKVVAKRHCSHCELTFKNQMTLLMHRINVHGVEKKEYKCPFCSKIFLVQHLVNAHVKATHKKNRSHACDKCAMAFFTKSELTRHLTVTHVDEKRFACSLCNARFKSKASLRRHVIKTVHRKVWDKL